MPWHGLGMLRHVFKILSLNRLGMLRHAVLWFLTAVHLMLRHDKTMPRHALLLCPELPISTPFYFTLPVIRSFYLNITYKIKTQVKIPKIGDKQYKTLSICKTLKFMRLYMVSEIEV